MNNNDSHNVPGDEVKYRPGLIESKWQKKWDDTSLYRTEDGRSKPFSYDHTSN